MLVPSEYFGIIVPYTFWQALLKIILGRDVPEVLLVAISNRNKAIIDKPISQIVEEDSQPIFFFYGLLNFLMSICALNKKISRLFVGAIPIEALDSHAFEVLE